QEATSVGAGCRRRALAVTDAGWAAPGTDGCQVAHAQAPTTPGGPLGQCSDLGWASPGQRRARSARTHAPTDTGWTTPPHRTGRTRVVGPHRWRQMGHGSVVTG